MIEIQKKYKLSIKIIKKSLKNYLKILKISKLEELYKTL